MQCFQQSPGPDLVETELNTLTLPSSAVVTTLSGSELQVVEAVLEQHSSLSTPDAAALVTAKPREAVLLTGDGGLRAAATGDGVEVHGHLWLLDRLLNHEVITAAEAADALEQMRDNGAYLPESEVSSRLQAWRKS